MARYAQIIDVLEEQLEELDKLGARVAAAHLDAAIVHLRYDSSKDRGGLN